MSTVHEQVRQVRASDAIDVHLPRFLIRRVASHRYAYAYFNRRQVSFGCIDDREALREARVRFDRCLAAFLANSRQLPAEVEPTAPYSVGTLVDDYQAHANTYYRNPDGTPGGEATNVRLALRLVKTLFAELPAAEFGPLALRQVREQMIANDLARREINQRVHRIRRAFRWAVSMEKLPAGVIHALESLEGLKVGRCAARETEPVRPVSEHDYLAVLPFLPRTIAAMVTLEWWTGARPSEICLMQGRHIDRSGTVWIYKPPLHKNTHRGQERTIAIGPKAQLVLAPFLKLDPDAVMFSPTRSELERSVGQRQRRKSKVTPSQKKRGEIARARQLAGERGRAPGEGYDVHSYRRAIHRACKRAEVPRWSPNQLRHSAATRIRKEEGLEAARVVLGHRRVVVTEIYAEVDQQRSLQIMQRLG